jgi:hypothetical protein
MTTVDRYCTENEVAGIDLLKLDVEGHELDVLDGAAGMLSERRIRLIAFEFGGTNIDSRIFFREIYNRLREADMPVGRITPSRYVFPIPAYREAYERFLATNFWLSWSNSQRNENVLFGQQALKPSASWSTSTSNSTI